MADGLAGVDTAVSMVADKASEADLRFASIQTDPRYRLPSRKHTHVQLDRRFAHMLRSDEFSRKALVDRYGRKLPSDRGRNQLRKFYRLDGEREGKQKEKSQNNRADDRFHDDDGDGNNGVVFEESADDDEEVEKELQRVDKKYDPARDGGFEESSSSEDSNESSELEDEEHQEKLDGRKGAESRLGQQTQADIPTGEISSRIAVVNLDWDNIRATDLMAVVQSFLPSSGRVLKVAVYPSEFGRERMERENFEGPPPGLFATSATQTSQNAQFQQHDKESSTPKSPQITECSTSSSSSSSEEDSGDDDEVIRSKLLSQSTDVKANVDIDSRALRAYQLSRLRYYYAVMTFDSAATAQHVYNEMDGREYLSSSNFLDFRFVPDYVTFDDPITDKPRDECERVPENYRPSEFVTEALTHSKVRLTWDEEEDTGRKEIQRRAFSGNGDVDEEDLRAYIGSGSSSEEVDSDNEAFKASGQANGAKRSTEDIPKADAARQRMRGLLGLYAPPPQSTSNSQSSRSDKHAPVGDMQITFSSGIAPTKPSNHCEQSGSVLSNKASEESTREKYIRKERERKTRRRLRAKTVRGDSEGLMLLQKEPNADFNEQKLDEEEDAESEESGKGREDPFEDSFFTSPSKYNAAARRAAKFRRRLRAGAESRVNEERARREREELALLMADEDGAAHAGSDQHVPGGPAKLINKPHFDMTAVRQQEKVGDRKRKKHRSVSKLVAIGEDRDANDIDVHDPRFANVLERHEYAIDPTNPRFTSSKGMRKLLEEGRKRRRDKIANSEDGLSQRRGRSHMQREEGRPNADSGKEEVHDSVARVKRRKAAT